MLKIGNIQPGRFMDRKADHVRKAIKMSKEEAVKILEKAGYVAKVENSVVIAKIDKFSQKEFAKIRKILRDAGYNSSFGVKNWKEGGNSVSEEGKTE